ncbi:MAG: hypothetical protein ACRD0K_01045 [Egibacteraceae bacterium]
MGIVDRKRDEEPGTGGSGVEVDLDLRRCPVCRRDLHPWERTCPVDGAEAVDRKLLTSTDFPPPPAHLLSDE